MDSWLLAFLCLSVLAVHTAATGLYGYHYESHSCTCPDYKEPVCGSNAETYDNPCIFRCQQSTWPFRDEPLTMRHTGPCGVEANANIMAAEPLCICTYLLAPVCATNGHTYPNQCQFECEQRKLASQGIIVSLLHSGACTQLVEPVCDCPVDGTPVCGNNGETYPNECRLRCDQRQDPTIYIEYVGECRIADMCSCTDEYSPVCGTNGRTYDNECEFGCARSHLGSADLMAIEHRGACGMSWTSDCACNKDYDPVCATDGKTYANECVFKCETSKQTPEPSLIHPGACVTSF